MLDRPEKKCYDEPNPTKEWLEAKFKAQQSKDSAPKDDE